MANLTGTQCFCAFFLTVVLTWLPGEAVYFESAQTHTHSSSQRQGRQRNSGSSSSTARQRRRERTRNNGDEDGPQLPERPERRRDSFQRIVVMCYSDEECGRKHFCHGGEGHKSCQPCRKSRKRCHRDEMCCGGRTCQDGRCRTIAESRAEIANSREDGLSYSEAEESFWNLEVTRKKQRGEDCTSANDCQEGLCCARHLFSRVCMPMLDEGDLCTKKKDRISELYQRCECKSGLSCKRIPNINTRLHACFPVKSYYSPEVIVVDNNPPTSSRHSSEDLDDLVNEAALSSSSSKSKRENHQQRAESNERSEQKTVYSIDVGPNSDPSPHRTVLKRSDAHRDKNPQTMVVSWSSCRFNASYHRQC